jgi:hypothetical protein
MVAITNVLAVERLHFSFFITFARKGSLSSTNFSSKGDLNLYLSIKLLSIKEYE